MSCLPGPGPGGPGHSSSEAALGWVAAVGVPCGTGWGPGGAGVPWARGESGLPEGHVLRLGKHYAKVNQGLRPPPSLIPFLVALLKEPAEFAKFKC